MSDEDEVKVRAYGIIQLMFTHEDFHEDLIRLLTDATRGLPDDNPFAQQCERLLKRQQELRGAINTYVEDVFRDIM